MPQSITSDPLDSCTVASTVRLVRLHSWHLVRVLPFCGLYMRERERFC